MSEELTISEQINKYGPQRLRRISVLNCYSGGRKHYKSYDHGYVTYTYTTVSLVIYADKDLYISPICKKAIQDILAILHYESCCYETEILYEYSNPYDYNSYFSCLVCEIINRFSYYYYAIPTHFVCHESEALWDGEPKSLDTLICPTAVKILHFNNNLCENAIKLRTKRASYPTEEYAENLLSIKQQRIQDDIAEFKMVRDLEWNDKDGSTRFYYTMKGKCTFLKFMQWWFEHGGSDGKKGVVTVYEGIYDIMDIYIYDNEFLSDWPDTLNDRMIEKAEFFIQKDRAVTYNIFLREN